MRDGLTLVEVLVASFVGLLMALPAYSMLMTATHEAAVSEDYAFAEALASRCLAETMAEPLEELAPRLPLDEDWSGVRPGDEALAAAWTDYGRNLQGDCAFRTRREVVEAAPGLWRYEVTVTWPVRPGARTLRTFAMVRFRARHDLAISARFPFPAVTGGPVR